LRPPYRTELPIFSFRQSILNGITEHQVIVVTGETGCGKTTQLPLFCLEALGQEARIAVTQPRRIAAASIAKKVADDLARPLGEMVGYRTRFDECACAGTRILFQTDGILVSEISRDRFYNRYDAIIIDEAHERNLNIDLIIGHLRWLVKRRPDLKVIVSSATINPELFAKAFNNAPIIRVEGRTFPIEIFYDPFDESEMDITQAAAKAVKRIADIDEQGDILMFMPTERHIISVKRKIDALSLRTPAVTLPLFARLSRAHQQRIFRPSNQRKIVIATNIAETSITVPGVRFVIDSGFARVKRYLPNSRITALPVERISRASADQRAGRCGRTQEGICIRLYSKDDYGAMEDFTSAEISRSNVAGVILTMLSQRLGAIGRFAFLESPPAKAIKDGEAHLWELGAIDNEGLLTAVGREMAVFPLDPHLSRMLVAAKKQGALVEALIIASALSCMDPRDRPIDNTDAADQAHKRFGDPISDFVWYINVWNAYHGEWGNAHSKSRMRAFCQRHFLSFMRMKEWRDVYTQLASIAGVKKKTGNGTFETIHKSLLTGLIANLATYTAETKIYKMSHGGTGFIFPGSMLAKKSHPWIMFAEKVETSRLFLRTVSRIDALWIAEVAPHLVRYRYSEPYFDEEAGTVRAMEHTIVFGLIIDQKNVAYGRINPKEASELFIREGLIENKLRTRHGFLAHNWTIREEVGSFEAKLRRIDLYAGDDVLFAWYAERIPTVTSIHDLNSVIRSNGGDGFLRITTDDLLTGALPEQAMLWPDTISIGGELFPCTYQCDPSSPSDGMTLHLPEEARQFVTEEMLSWLIMPQWEARIEALFERLPRETRKRLIPLSDSAERCARMLCPGHCHFCVALSQVAKNAFGIDIAVSDLMSAEIPAFLWSHVVFDDNRPQARQAINRWRSAFSAGERKSVKQWDFGDIPESVIVVDDPSGFSLKGFPALRDNGASIDLMSAVSKAEAKRLHADGVVAFVRQELEQELTWLRKNASIDGNDRLRIASLGDFTQIIQKARNAVIEKFAAPADPLCRSQQEFNAHIIRAKEELGPSLRGLITELAQSGAISASLSGNLAALKKSTHAAARNLPIIKSLIDELHGYIAIVASDEADFDYLSRLQRYLKRLDITVRRAVNDPLRYSQRMNDIRPYEDQLRLGRQAPLRVRKYCRKLLEEYKISLFAQQEVKALPGTSEKKLREAFAEMR
jgi:ATP-dependent helicase HrpA